jgi:hypothetical protein
MFTRPHSARWALIVFRLASHHLAIFSRFSVGTMTHPCAHGFASGLLLLPAPHTMLRIVFVAVDWMVLVNIMDLVTSQRVTGIF